MDSFTIAVLAGDALILLAILALVIMDKKSGGVEAGQPSGKR